MSVPNACFFKDLEGLTVGRMSAGISGPKLPFWADFPFLKIPVSVKFVSAILGPEMAAPILWAPRISAFFLQENLHVHKFPRFGGGGLFWVWGGESADFTFVGAGIFLSNKERMSHLCDSTVADPTAQRDNVLARKCEYPPFRCPPFK